MKPKLTGFNTFSPITLKRGITDSDELWKWRQTVIDGKTQRRNGSIVLRGETGADKISWNFSEAWPSKWTGPSFIQFNSTFQFDLSIRPVPPSLLRRWKSLTKR